jgi:hypothetical protein
MLVLEKRCSILLYNSNDLFVWCSYGHGKKEIIKNKHDVICSHVWLWQKTMTLQRKYLKTSMVAMDLLKVGLTKNQGFLNANKKESLVMGFRLPLKAMKLS